MDDDIRSAMIERLVINDVYDIRQGLANDDVEFITNVLTGNGWKPYSQLTDDEIIREYSDRFEGDDL